MNIKAFAFFVLILASALPIAAQPPGGAQWRLVFEDDFSYNDSELEKTWWVQNSPSKHILSSRWRENVRVDGGFLRLLNKKQERGGQQWTSGNVRTREKFLYGYFECRYKYAASSGVNNAFWLCADDREIDINEGHYPNEINTNVHDRTLKLQDARGREIRHADPQNFALGAQSRPDIGVQFNQPILTSKIRISTKQRGQIHLREIGIYPESAGGYPDLMKGARGGDAENFARGAKLAVSGAYSDAKRDGADFLPENAVDGSLGTAWVSQPLGEKFIELDLGGQKSVSSVRFVAGWRKAQAWNNTLDEYRVQYFKDGAWVDAFVKEKSELSKEFDLSGEFHTYGCEWSAEEIVFYFDGREIRRIKNERFHVPMHVWLSTAVLLWAGDGEIPESVNGTEMAVDWVRVYEKAPAAQ